MSYIFLLCNDKDNPLHFVHLIRNCIGSKFNPRGNFFFIKPLERKHVKLILMRKRQKTRNWLEKTLPTTQILRVSLVLQCFQFLPIDHLSKDIINDIFRKQKSWKVALIIQVIYSQGSLIRFNFLCSFSSLIIYKIVSEDDAFIGHQ